MRRCTRCVMPDTRPGLTFDAEGVCAACRAYEARTRVDYAARRRELAALCDEHRGIGGGYDCIIAVSGGKDSHYQAHVMREEMHMTPLLISVSDNFPMTAAGQHNIANISEAFGCDLIIWRPDIAAQKKVMRYCFEKHGMPTYYTDRYIYTVPLWFSYLMNIPLVVYGENVQYEYSGIGPETPSARAQIENGVASGIPWGAMGKATGLPRPPLFDPPIMDGIEPTYLSYYDAWNSFDHYQFAESRGFRSLHGEWERTCCIEDWNQVDTRAYLVHPWLKYPKYGHSMATDISARMVRYGKLARAEALELVAKHDHNLDPLCVQDFCAFCGYSEKEFWAIVDKFYNPALFTKTEHGWILNEEA